MFENVLETMLNKIYQINVFFQASNSANGTQVPSCVEQAGNGVISKAQKQQKEFKVSKNYLLQFPKNTKVEPNRRASGTLWGFFFEKSLNVEKTERGTL